jgi:tetratricopeptide (TPR) repeat protein
MTLNTSPRLKAAREYLAQNKPLEAMPVLEGLLKDGQESAALFNCLGSCLLKLDDPIAAGRAFKRAVDLDRSQAASYYNLGLALKLAGSNFEAFATFQRALQIDPGLLDAYLQLGGQMKHASHLQTGIPILEQGLRLYPSSTDLMKLLASAYGRAGRFDEGEKLFRIAIETDPRVLPSYAHWLQEQGRFEESVPVLRKAVSENPNLGQAYFGLATARSYEAGMLGRVLKALEVPGSSDENQMFLHYAAAKIYDHESDYQAAMSHYDKANALAYELFNKGVVHDDAAADREHEVLRKLYSLDDLERLAAFGSDSDLPILIVGMIRTGTTLLDQMLASHPDVASAGEQPFWQVMAGRVNRRRTELGDNPQDIKELAPMYLDTLHKAAGEAKRIVDKMPTNYYHLGLVHVVFPKAKIIHLRRNPVDTCLSIYTTFLGAGTKFAYSQDLIVGYYRDYLRTMELWRSVLPSSQFMEVDYEELVSNKEAVLRRVLEFCGLDWNDAVLRHEEQTSHVVTPSLWTARQPVNTESVERWRRYEPWLGKLAELKDVHHPPVQST